jgi:predicted regulator of Ras-like GTPase activity (Roadblock/LC7/MglB family)
VIQPEVSKSGPQIRLPLRSILRGIAPCQLSGPTDSVPEDEVIELPFAIVQPQLSSGKISISPAQFQAALPEKCRDAFTIEDQVTPISLPLQEVLQNLPGETLKIRDDQEAIDVHPDFETPFSLKAAEDAARLKSPDAETTPTDSPAPIAPVKLAAQKSSEPKSAEVIPSPSVPPAPAVPTAPPAASTPVVPTATAPTPVRLAAPPPAVVRPPAKPERDPLQTVFDTDETMDAKNVIAHASRLPGVRACALFFSDGLSLAGNMPSEFKIDPLCAIAPALVRKCLEQMASTNLGTFAGLTLSCTKSAITFFAHGDICLAALHWAGREIEIATRTQLSSVTAELARTYAPTEKVSA